MAAASQTAAVLVMAAAVLLTAASSSSPAAAPGGMDSACTNALLNMSDCLTFVEKGSAAPCCPELAGMVASNPVCLCELLSGAAESYGIAVDYGRALALPGICRVPTPPVSACAALGYHVHLGPAAAPVSAISPAAEGPRFPGSAPSGSPPAATSHAARRSSSGHVVATLIAVLPLAVAAISGIML